jgi:IclR family pca regulon transcriptional regulator
MTPNISSTFVKGLSLFKAFDHANSRLTLADIARRTGMDRASVRRLTLTLVHLGYVAKEDRFYALTPKVLVLAGSFLRGNHFGSQIQPILDRFAAELGSELSMAIIDETDAVYVAKSTLSTSAVSFGFTIGSRLPLLQTAIGRMLLAVEGEELREAIITQTQLQAHTPHSLLDRDALRRAIGQIRVNGFAKVEGAFEVGITGLAVPVLPVRGAQAVLGASAPQIQLGRPDTEERFLDVLFRCAAEINRSYAPATGDAP